MSGDYDDDSDDWSDDDFDDFDFDEDDDGDFNEELWERDVA